MILNTIDVLLLIYVLSRSRFKHISNKYGLGYNDVLSNPYLRLQWQFVLGRRFYLS